MASSAVQSAAACDAAAAALAADDPEEALAAAEAAVVLQPESSRAWSLRAQALNELQLFADVLAAVAAVAGVLIKQRLDRPSRPYEDGSVGREYDAWTREGILEHYWGEHIHLGYYGEDERRAPFYGGKDFVEAKYDFIDKMLEFSKARAIRRNFFGAIRRNLRNAARLCAIL